MNLYLPFDYNPLSVSVKTAVYTIPANRYARVLVCLYGTGDFSINGNVALKGNQNIALASSSLGTGLIGSPTTFALATANPTAGSAGPAFTSDNNIPTTVAEYWLPSGTQINGSGDWRATVTEYPVIA